MANHDLPEGVVRVDLLIEHKHTRRQRAEIPQH